MDSGHRNDVGSHRTVEMTYATKSGPGHAKAATLRAFTDVPGVAPADDGCSGRFDPPLRFGRRTMNTHNTLAWRTSLVLMVITSLFTIGLAMAPRADAETWQPPRSFP